MKFVEGLDRFRAERPWGALDIGEIDGVTVRLHWTDQPYVWHVNNGPEAFIVVSGTVDMRYRHDGVEQVRRLHAGEACFAEIGDEHVAHPLCEARILVVERKGSV